MCVYVMWFCVCGVGVRRCGVCGVVCGVWCVGYGVGCVSGMVFVSVCVCYGGGGVCEGCGGGGGCDVCVCGLWCGWGVSTVCMWDPVVFPPCWFQESNSGPKTLLPLSHLVFPGLS